MQTSPHRFDAVVVGARCAGAATALLLSQAGARVLVVDRERYRSDTSSTHALMRGGVLQLARWGVLPAIVAGGTPPVRATTFSYSDQEIALAIEPEFGVAALYAPRRTLLDRVLVDAARAAGAEFLFGVRAERITMDGRGRVRGLALAGAAPRHVAADLVIGADGLHSTVARQVGAQTIVAGQHRAAVLYTYFEGYKDPKDPKDHEYFWGFRPGISCGAIPTNDHATCVFVSVPAARFGDELRGGTEAAFNRLILRTPPAFAARLQAARRVEPIRGFGGEPGRIRTGFGPGWALVGDAGCFMDPCNAHGITSALRDAELLARAAADGSERGMAEYEATRLDLSRPLFALTDAIASFEADSIELQRLHRACSREMSREARALAALAPMSDVRARLTAVDGNARAADPARA
jgi:flavin-dependent dehydrogenase